MSQPESRKSETLDELLAGAKWELIDQQRTDRMMAKWNEIIDSANRTKLDLSIDDCLDEAQQGSGGVNPVGNLVPPTSFFGHWSGQMAAVIAVALVLATIAWMIRANLINSEVVSNNSPESEFVASAESLNAATKKRPNESSLKSTAPLPTVDQMFATLAKNRDRRLGRGQVDVVNRRLIDGSVYIGNSTFLSSSLEILLTQLDHTMNNWSASRHRSRREIANSYFPVRKKWERWIWQQLDSCHPSQRVALARIGAVLAGRRSVDRLFEHLADPQLTAYAARAVTRAGSVAHIDKAMGIVTTNRSRSILLSSLLSESSPQGSRVFLKYLRRTETRELAINVIHHADSVPANNWLRIMMAKDGQQWDAALAIGHVCDQQAMNALIDLAWQPETARPALVALLLSPCDAAKQFVAFAERDERLIAQVAVAKRKLKNLENFFNFEPPGAIPFEL